jgi:YfiH family protein
MNIPFFSAPGLKWTGITHGFFTRQGGVGKGIFESLNCAYKEGQPREEIDENLRRVREALGCPQGILCGLNQVHGDKVLVVSKEWDTKNTSEADALVTREKGYLLTILTADCVPVLFLDDQNHVIGAAHAGWRSAYSGIIHNTVESMCDLGATRQTLKAVIGPCIHQESYEVSQDFKEDFLNQSLSHEKYFKNSANPNHFLFNLPLYVYDRLQEEALESVEWIQENTYTQPDTFFSCRRSAHQGYKTFGNQISVIGLKR